MVPAKEMTTTLPRSEKQTERIYILTVVRKLLHDHHDTLLEAMKQRKISGYDDMSSCASVARVNGDDNQGHGLNTWRTDEKLRNSISARIKISAILRLGNTIANHIRDPNVPAKLAEFRDVLLKARDANPDSKTVDFDSFIRSDHLETFSALVEQAAPSVEEGLNGHDFLKDMNDKKEEKKKRGKSMRDDDVHPSSIDDGYSPKTTKKMRDTKHVEHGVTQQSAEKEEAPDDYHANDDRGKQRTQHDDDARTHVHKQSNGAFDDEKEGELAARTLAMAYPMYAHPVLYGVLDQLTKRSESSESSRTVHKFLECVRIFR